MVNDDDSELDGEFEDAELYNPVWYARAYENSSHFYLSHFFQVVRGGRQKRAAAGRSS